jgi:hypothetical protein
MAPWPDARHRPGIRHGQHLAPLKPTEQDPGVEPALVGQRRALHDAMEPHQGLVGGAHTKGICHSGGEVPGGRSHMLYMGNVVPDDGLFESI